MLSACAFRGLDRRVLPRSARGSLLAGPGARLVCSTSDPDTARACVDDPDRP